MATGPESLRTKPSMAPPFHCVWVAVQLLLGWCLSWHVFGMWKARSTRPCASRLAFVGGPLAGSAAAGYRRHARGVPALAARAGVEGDAGCDRAHAAEEPPARQLHQF